MKADKREDDLIKAARAGDRDALLELITPYRERVYAMVFRLVHNHSDTEDIIQEAFIRMFAAMGKFRGESSFFTWLFRIVVNTSLDYLRRKGKRKEISVDNPAVNEALLAERPERRPDEEAEAGERRRLVAAALGSLSLVHRMVVVLHDFEGLSHREIARIMNCREGTVWSRLYYAREELRRRLRKYFGPGRNQKSEDRGQTSEDR